MRLLAAASAVAERVWGYASEGADCVWGLRGNLQVVFWRGVRTLILVDIVWKKKAIIGIINIIIISSIIN